LECAAIQDILVVGGALDKQVSRERKIDLDRMAAMLSRLGGRGCCVKDPSGSSGKKHSIPIPIAISIPIESTQHFEILPAQPSGKPDPSGVTNLFHQASRFVVILVLSWPSAAAWAGYLNDEG